MTADVESVVLATQAALPFLAEHRGSVANVASVAGLGGDPGMTIYNTAKRRGRQPDPVTGGRAAAQGVQVTAVAPSLTTTDATPDIPANDIAEFLHRIPMGRAAKPAEVAD
jgi:meso-butanediol dehydrogenase/(S,S)-butanediol dehydrogenase/diacetyl reductase